MRRTKPPEARSATSRKSTAEWLETPHVPRALLARQLASLLMLALLALLALPDDPGEHVWSSTKEAIQSPWVLVPLAFAFFLVLMWTIRLSAFRGLVRAPGPIRLVSFEDGTAPPPPIIASPLQPVANGPQEPSQTHQPVNVIVGAGPGAPADPANQVPVAHLSMHLRDRLAELRLTLPSAIPAAKRSSDFVELLGSTKVDVKQPFAAIGSVLRLMRPTHAYELKATLLCREEEPKYGVATELAMLPGGHTVFRTYWDDSWPHTLDRAASGVGAQVVPHSRHADTGPWCSWRGKALSDELFYAYQRAQRRWAQRRYDEGLEEYYAALRLDPVNEYLRNELGQAQEARALYLDALLTYHAGLKSLEKRPSSGLDKAAKLARTRIEVLTRYRFTALIGFGERLARQWLPAPPNAPETRRSEELSQLRARLRPILRELYLDETGRVLAAPDDLTLLGLDGADAKERLEELLSEAVERPRPHARRDKKKKVATPSEEEIEQARQRSRQARKRARAIRKVELQLLFQLFAETEVNRMLDHVSGLSGAQVAQPSAGLTLTTFQLLKPWIEQRTEHARILLRHERGETIEEGAWPPSPRQIAKRWSELRHKGVSLDQRLAKSSMFTDHYNAACTYAVGLAHDPGMPHPRRFTEPLVECALAELQRAFDVAPSSTITSRWEWIASKDPDLAGLRGEPGFRRFESERLPSARPAPRRPADIEDFQASRDNKWLIKRYARVLERIWHNRSDLNGSTDIHTAMRWWKEEALAWEHARELVLHHRHWQTRVSVVRWLRTVAEGNGVEPVRFMAPSYAENPLDVDEAEVDRVAASYVQGTNLRLAALYRALSLEPDDGATRHEPKSRGRGRPDGLPGIKEWKQRFDALDHAGENLDENTRHRLAVQRAAAWSALHQFLDTEKSADEARAALNAGVHGLLKSLKEPEPAPQRH